MKKWLILFIYIGGACTVFLYRTPILGWLQEGRHLPLTAGAAALLALFPVLPYKLVIGLLGYAYGSLTAALICWAASTLASALIYGLVKSAFQQKAKAYLAAVPALGKFTAMVKKRPFLSIVLARLTPIIPQTAVNVYAGVAGLRFWSYLGASALGKIPGISLYAFLGGEMFHHPRSAVMAVAAYGAVLLAAGFALVPRAFRAK
ncbi:TVP38/TMEM64 family protein [Paenibacillus sp. NFR01]|uniref:TVP38/TMEM64 family protein n=1 Tax=Paenibacillus sp. NFR01 TaxID=1566279 RepID=UPI0008C5224A|nr:VTT domain-containing protein [Paenibacillus sp. NFR01]SET59412.1 Uncharacterized membrane protein YdjX, TVP38/TMEM64 family, SNARE-associated domain [Paenibacillus sp. NFR01]